MLRWPYLNVRSNTGMAFAVMAYPVMAWPCRKVPPPRESYGPTCLPCTLDAALILVAHIAMAHIVMGCIVMAQRASHVPWMPPEWSRDIASYGAEVLSVR